MCNSRKVRCHLPWFWGYSVHDQKTNWFWEVSIRKLSFLHTLTKMWVMPNSPPLWYLVCFFRCFITGLSQKSTCLWYFGLWIHSKFPLLSSSSLIAYVMTHFSSTSRIDLSFMPILQTWDKLDAKVDFFFFFKS